ncbi:serine hydrolase domain-containing protein [Allonocardiopsis opalescens]|uniref:serine hydrolase domain-containing protein n=1 Tax=Allonocardiopsis opalescens TaxID=1144618 RepID=UPI0014744F57|nr:serine hydrolase domain-containing protein [Allonocardiopsis opalescens]
MNPTPILLGALVLCGALLAGAVPAAPAAAAEAPAPAAVDRYLTESLRAAGLPGAVVAITRGDEVLHTAGYGRDSAGAPLSAGSPVAIASLSKSFTALAVAMLAEEGRLDLDAPVREYLPEFRTADPRSDRITARMLLTHTSGLSDSVFPEMSREQPADLRGAVARLAEVRLSADPGSTWSYHNPNYHVAARLVEAVSGRPFADHLSERVFGPAGMTATATRDSAAERPYGLPDGYAPVFGAMVARPALDHFVNGSGGIVSTAEDLARWLIVQSNGGVAADGTRVVSAAALAATRETVPAGGDYALGWDLDTDGERVLRVHHGGTMFSASAEQVLLPADGDGGGADYGVAIAFNSASATGAEQLAIAEGLVELVRGGSPEPPAPVSAITDAVLAALCAATVLLGVVRVRRAPAWARRRARRGRALIALGLAPRLVPIALFLGLPALAGLLLGGRDVTWPTILYSWPALAAWAGLAAAASAWMLAARLRAWARARRAGGARPPEPRPIDATRQLP